MEEVKLHASERKRRFLRALHEKALVDWAKLMMVVVPLLHLILSPIHVAALLKLEDQICGFVMFLSILVGLVVLFEATRVKADDAASKIMFLLGMAVDGLLMVWLLCIYRYALGNQQTLREPEVVVRAVGLSVCMIGCYLAASLLTILSFFRGRKRA